MSFAREEIIHEFLDTTKTLVHPFERLAQRLFERSLDARKNPPKDPPGQVARTNCPRCGRRIEMRPGNPRPIHLARQMPGEPICRPLRDRE